MVSWHGDQRRLCHRHPACCICRMFGQLNSPLPLPPPLRIPAQPSPAHLTYLTTTSTPLDTIVMSNGGSLPPPQTRVFSPSARQGYIQQKRLKSTSCAIAHTSTRQFRSSSTATSTAFSLPARQPPRQTERPGDASSFVFCLARCRHCSAP